MFRYQGAFSGCDVVEHTNGCAYCEHACDYIRPTQLEDARRSKRDGILWYRKTTDRENFASIRHSRREKKSSAHSRDDSSTESGGNIRLIQILDILLVNGFQIEIFVRENIDADT